jgi:hypothetical protein
MQASNAVERAPPAPGEELLHPVMLLAVSTLIVNDHVLKPLWPGVLTGKLSDFAGLVFFPALLQALWEIGRVWSGRQCVHSSSVLWRCALLTAAVFAFTKLSSPGAALYRVGLGAIRSLPGAALDLVHGEAPRWALARFTQDPSDAVALPAVLVGLFLFRARGRAA